MESFKNHYIRPQNVDMPAANKRFAAMLARRCCNEPEIFNQQRPQGDLYKLSLISLQVHFFVSFDRRKMLAANVQVFMKFGF